MYGGLTPVLPGLMNFSPSPLASTNYKKVWHHWNQFTHSLLNAPFLSLSPDNTLTKTTSFFKEILFFATGGKRARDESKKKTRFQEEILTHPMTLIVGACLLTLNSNYSSQQTTFNSNLFQSFQVLVSSIAVMNHCIQVAYNPTQFLKLD